jgi:GntR family transcriptional regulator
MDFSNDQAIYLQIADHFIENILLGKWRPGDRILSVREMAVNIEVNPNTVMRTYTYLQEKEIIYNKRGIGYFVADDGAQKALALRKEDFVSRELPKLFKFMNLLNLSIDDLKKYHEQYSNQEPPNL